VPIFQKKGLCFYAIFCRHCTPRGFLQQAVVFQKRWTTNGLPEIVEPHITVKAQSGLTEDMNWLNKFKEIFLWFPQFKLSLTAPVSSTHNEVVWLGVDSNHICELHRHLVHAVSPSAEQIAKSRELDRYAPHLTLGQTLWGMTRSELTDMKSEAASVLAPYPTFTVSQVRIYQEIEPNKYVPLEDISLKRV
jgi:2'-5' RNA ligase